MPSYTCEVKECDRPSIGIMTKDGSSHLVCDKHMEKWRAA